MSARLEAAGLKQVWVTKDELEVLIHAMDELIECGFADAHDEFDASDLHRYLLIESKRHATS